jgi:rod shape-determining protein MreC
MENLLRFLAKASSLILFVFLQTVALLLLVSHNNYQQSIALSSANVVTGNMYATISSFTEYFYLQTTNTLLAEENTTLKNENIMLQEQLTMVQQPATKKDSIQHLFTYISAKVINSSVNKQQNYITLNKGSKDGIKPDMGVINSEGVVGIVSSVSNNFAVVMPIINPRIKISCRISKNDYYGSLVWEGRSAAFANLKEIPEHVQLQKGDSIITSGFSSIFPEGISVGTVEEVKTSKYNNFHDIKVRLNVNFQTLSYVNVIEFAQRVELNNLENIQLQ